MPRVLGAVESEWAVYWSDARHCDTRSVALGEVQELREGLFREREQIQVRGEQTYSRLSLGRNAGIGPRFIESVVLKAFIFCATYHTGYPRPEAKQVNTANSLENHLLIMPHGV